MDKASEEHETVVTGWELVFSSVRFIKSTLLGIRHNLEGSVAESAETSEICFAKDTAADQPDFILSLPEISGSVPLYAEPSTQNFSADPGVTSAAGIHSENVDHLRTRMAVLEPDKVQANNNLIHLQHQHDQLRERITLSTNAEIAIRDRKIDQLQKSAEETLLSSKESNASLTELQKAFRRLTDENARLVSAREELFVMVESLKKNVLQKEALLHDLQTGPRLLEVGVQYELADQKQKNSGVATENAFHGSGVGGKRKAVRVPAVFNDKKPEYKVDRNPKLEKVARNLRHQNCFTASEIEMRKIMSNSTSLPCNLHVLENEPEDSYLESTRIPPSRQSSISSRTQSGCGFSYKDLTPTRIEELKRRNAAQKLPHLRSSYPVEQTERTWRHDTPEEAVSESSENKDVSALTENQTSNVKKGGLLKKIQSSLQRHKTKDHYFASKENVPTTTTLFETVTVKPREKPVAFVIDVTPVKKDKTRKKRH